MRIPTNVNKLIVKQFVKLSKIEESELSEFEKGEQILSLVSGLTIDQINELKLWKLDYYFKQIAQLRASKPNLKPNKWLLIKGRIYRLAKDEKHLNTNQLTAADTLSVDSASNFSKLAAIVYTYKGKFTDKSFEDLTEYFNNCKVGRVYGAVFFYSNRFKYLKVISQIYLNQSLQVIKERLQEIKSKTTDGTELLTVSRAEMLLKKMS